MIFYPILQPVILIVLSVIKMCRMILALGKVDTSRIIDAAIKMALDQTLLHEYNQKHGMGSWQHDDGWGLAYLDEHNQWIVNKSTTVIFKDKKIEPFRKINTRLLLLHVRKSSGSNKSILNTHPFVVKDLLLETDTPETCLFCHNGSINEEIYYDQSKYHLSGQTDSEKLFYSILTDLNNNINEKKKNNEKKNENNNEKNNKNNKNLVKAIRNNFERYQKLNGTNLILSKNNQSIVAVRKNKAPIYYQMYIGKTKDSLIFSSEKLPFAEFKWQPLEQGDIVIIDHKTLTYTVDKEI